MRVTNSGTSVIFMATTTSATTMYADAMTGTSTSVTEDSRRTPPKMTSPVMAANTRPMIKPDPRPVRLNWLRTDSEMELAWTALNTNP